MGRTLHPAISGMAYAHIPVVRALVDIPLGTTLDVGRLINQFLTRDGMDDNRIHRTAQRILDLVLLPYETANCRVVQRGAYGTRVITTDRVVQGSMLTVGQIDAVEATRHPIRVQPAIEAVLSDWYRQTDYDASSADDERAESDAAYLRVSLCSSFLATLDVRLFENARDQLLAGSSHRQLDSLMRIVWADQPTPTPTPMDTESPPASPIPSEPADLDTLIESYIDGQLRSPINNPRPSGGVHNAQNTSLRFRSMSNHF